MRVVPRGHVDSLGCKAFVLVIMASKSVSKPNSGLVKVYLVCFNLFSFVAWLRVFAGILLYMVNGSGARPMLNHSLTNLVQSRLPMPAPAQFPDYTGHSEFISEMLYRASTLYNYIGPLVIVVQSLAILEFVHALFGLVKSSLFVVLVQVCSRLLLVWFTVPLYQASQQTPFFAVMVFAWSLSEIIRYPFYVNQLLDSLSFPVLWARYSFFTVLYPLGVLSEMQLLWASLPKGVAWPWVDLAGWSVRDLFFLALLPVYVPGLFFLYSGLLKSRRKVLGNDFIGSKGLAAVRENRQKRLAHLRQLAQKAR